MNDYKNDSSVGPTAHDEIFNAVERETGQKHSYAKTLTDVDGYIVLENKVTGEYSAYNASKWDMNTMKSMDDYRAVAVEGVDVVRKLELRQELEREWGVWRTGVG